MYIVYLLSKVHRVGETKPYATYEQKKSTTQA